MTLYRYSSGIDVDFVELLSMPVYRLCVLVYACGGLTHTFHRSDRGFKRELDPVKRRFFSVDRVPVLFEITGFTLKRRERIVFKRNSNGTREV